MPKKFLLLFLLIAAVEAGNAATPVNDSVLAKTKSYHATGEKWYCSAYAKTKYKLLITGSKISITRFYKEFTDTYSGTIKKGKIYSNDPNEKSLKDVWGKYYKLDGKNFGVLNIENGDYEWFAECKH